MLGLHQALGNARPQAGHGYTPLAALGQALRRRGHGFSFGDRSGRLSGYLSGCRSECRRGHSGPVRGFPGGSRARLTLGPGRSFCLHFQMTQHVLLEDAPSLAAAPDLPWLQAVLGDEPAGGGRDRSAHRGGLQTGGALIGAAHLTGDMRLAGRRRGGRTHRGLRDIVSGGQDAQILAGTYGLALAGQDLL